ncbi:extracellular calcium-sensing receptor isoform X2 [Hydra vulgaris]|uniref:Extracellular calcium-sensing receptor isoform X2 n=1 Tax=Hydra vulgaris TaxID=6087 RepID=A0ABM4C615_HYDVU
MYQITTCYFYFHFVPVAVVYSIQNCGNSNVVLRRLANKTYFFGGIFPTHSQNGDFYSLNKAAILLVSSMMLAIKEINKNKELLPGIKIGYDIRDSRNEVLCACDHALDFLLDKKRNSVLIGVVGPASSSLSAAVSTLLQPDFVPQVSYSSTSMSLSKRSIYRNFFRTAPNDAYQAKALIALIEHFHWTYISLFTSDNDYGRFGREEVQKAAKEKNICLSVDRIFNISLSNNETDIIFESIEKNSRIVVLWCDSQYARTIISKSISLGLGNITWIGTDSWENELLILSFSNISNNIFILRLKEYAINVINNELYNNITSKINCQNPWFNELMNSNSTSGFDCIPSLASSLSKRKINQVFGAVYALAHGLHNYLNCSFEKCVTTYDSIDYELLYHHVINTSFSIPASDYNIKFDENGDFSFPAYEYTFFDFNRFTKFGIWEYNFNLSLTVFINDSIIAWKDSKIPQSVCSVDCPPGTYRVNSTISVCCWSCIPCPQSSITNAANQYNCTRCSATSFVNLNQHQCVDLPEINLTFLRLEGVFIILGSISGVLGTSFVLILFFMYWNNPIIKSSNREMSCIQLFAFKFLFCISFLHFWKPTQTMCMLRTLLFNFLFTTVLSFIVVKTYRLLRVFNGRFTRVSKFLDNKFQITFSFSLVLIETVANLIWNLFYPTKVIIFVNSAHNKFHIVCENKELFLASFIYFFTFTAVCGYMAFRARKLPENFNETHYIAYAMLTTCIFWITYIPIRFSTDPYESNVAFLCINILSCHSMLLILYGKKVKYLLRNPNISRVNFFSSSSRDKIMDNFNTTVDQKNGISFKFVCNVVELNSSKHSELSCQSKDTLNQFIC